MLHKGRHRARRRRNDLARMKRRAKKVYGHEGSIKLANHIQCCSCWACGNQRNAEGDTLQEERHKLALQDWIDSDQAA